MMKNLITEKLTKQDIKGNKININFVKVNSGITLIALVISIVVLLILAGVSIATLTGENGILTQAQKSKEATEQGAKKEQSDLDQIEDYIDRATGRKTANKPRLMEGMTPVYWDVSGNEIRTISTDEKWYNYDEQRWANAVTEDGSYWVWIPRYEYKVTNGVTDPADAGTVEVNFIAKETTTASSSEFTIHPAFRDESKLDVPYANGGWDEELAGIWVAKYEMSMEENGVAKVPNGDTIPGNIATSNTIKMVSKPGVISWRYINIANSYTNSYNYDRSKDSHLIKNSEWGAVAFLTHSKYGRNGIEVTINENTSYYTGGSKSAIATTNVTQSTTGNATGIYDMSGGAWERVATFNKAYSDSYYTAADYVDANKKHFASTNGASTKYATAYSNSTGTSYGDFTKGDVSHVGDAIHEVYVSGDRGWFNDYNGFMHCGNPFFGRGGIWYDRDKAGMFASYNAYGGGNYGFAFRVALPGV